MLVAQSVGRKRLVSAIWTISINQAQVRDSLVPERTTYRKRGHPLDRKLRKICDADHSKRSLGCIADSGHGLVVAT